MVSGVFFDAEGVLYTRDRSTSAAAGALLQRDGYSTDLPAPVTTELAALNSRAKRGLVSSDVYWDEYLSRHGVATERERDGLRQQIMDHAQRVVSLPGARSTLMTLKERGLKLGVITDTIYPVEMKRGWLDCIGVAELIDVMACSSSIGAHKPDPAIYHDALTHADLTPSEAAFVGHDARELTGAKNIGMITIAVHADGEVAADYICGNLPELLTVPDLSGAASRTG